MEKLFENENGYVYPVENGFRVYWKKEELKPNVDIKFTNFNEAWFYLNSIK